MRDNIVDYIVKHTRPGPKLMTDTQHSTLTVFEWGILSLDSTLKIPYSNKWS